MCKTTTKGCQNSALVLIEQLLLGGKGSAAALDNWHLNAT